MARRRVATLLNSNPALGFRDPNYSQEPSASRKAGTSQRRRYQDLESGTAALEIADAFLRGSVGKELVSTSEGDGTDYLLDEEEIQDLSPLQAQRRAAAMLGMTCFFPFSFFSLNLFVLIINRYFESRQYRSSSASIIFFLCTTILRYGLSFLEREDHRTRA